MAAAATTASMAAPISPYDFASNPGLDIMTGGGGHDIFEGRIWYDTFRPGYSTPALGEQPAIVTDFKHGQDQLDLVYLSARQQRLQPHARPVRPRRHQP